GPHSRRRRARGPRTGDDRRRPHHRQGDRDHATRHRRRIQKPPATSREMPATRQTRPTGERKRKVDVRGSVAEAKTQKATGAAAMTSIEARVCEVSARTSPATASRSRRLPATPSTPPARAPPV